MLAFLRRLFASVAVPSRGRNPAEPATRRTIETSLAEEAARTAPAWTDARALEEALRDYSGYFRQAAVERCAELRLPQSLTLAATRLNDWVPQVREAAQNAVLELLPEAGRDAQLATLYMVGELRNAGRVDHEVWIAEFERNWLSAVGEQALWQGLSSGSRKQARACFELLRKQPGVPLTRLLTLCVASRDDILLALRSVEMAYQLDAGHAATVLKSAMASCFGSVRRIALQKLLQGADGALLAQKYLFDPHATVRGLAIARLRGDGFDVAGAYRGVLLDTSTPPPGKRIAILSLAGLDCKDDLDLIKAFARSEAVRLRTAAYAAWFKLAAGEKDALVLQALADESVSVRKFARTAMERHGAYVAFSDIYRLFGKSTTTLDLMSVARSHKWNWLEAIATVARDLPSDSPLRERLAVELRSWIYNAKWSRHRPIGRQGHDLACLATLAALESLIADETEQVALLRDQVKSAVETPA
ncbi:hypothetical protein [Pseudoduganella sp.]|uniref:hypothetical protein n=1 Tax=Pseudoduganella sp. TaxID=1880898 RepID=UPI0035B4DD00